MPVQLLTFSRSPKQYREALQTAEELAPIREALQTAGHAMELDSGAKVLVQVNDYAPVIEFIRMNETVYSTQHLFVDSDIEATVLEVLSRLPKTNKLKASSIQIVPLEVAIANVQKDRKHRLEVVKTFIDIPGTTCAKLLSSSDTATGTFTMSSGDANPGRKVPNPRKFGKGAQTCVQAHHSKVRDLHRKNPGDVCAIADAIIDASVCCGIQGINPHFRMQKKEEHAFAPGFWSQELSSTYTTALAAALMREDIVAAFQQRTESGTKPEPPSADFRLHIIGCRWYKEGAIDFEALVSLMTKILDGVSFTTLKIGLLGPEMAGRNQAEAGIRGAMANSAGKLKIQISAKCYHDSPPLPADFAVILNGGIDSGFGTWGSTIQLLLTRGTPTAITGYAPFDKMGCERLLVKMQAAVKVSSFSNPFRYNITQSASDAFIVGICGPADGSRIPAFGQDLDAIHRWERIEKIKDLEKLNADDGYMDAVAQLKLIRRQLENGLIIPPMVTHGAIEQWALGQAPAAW